jgi:LmbE family N-acetylglucosaminyl deacetylase
LGPSPSDPRRGDLLIPLEFDRALDRPSVQPPAALEEQGRLADDPSFLDRLNLESSIERGKLRPLDLRAGVSMGGEAGIHVIFLGNPFSGNWIRTRLGHAGKAIDEEERTMLVTRRDALGTMLSLSSAASLSSVAGARDAQPKSPRLKVVFAGAHPDDQETCAGGTMARCSDLGHDVVSLYLTRGEVGIRGKSKEDTASQRSAEVGKGCEILRVRPRFVGQLDGSTEVNPSRYVEYAKLLNEEDPDIVFTWWPFEPHRDHRAVWSLVYDAWLRSKKRFSLYYFAGSDTRLFAPTFLVDITETESRKRAACFCDTWYKDRPDLDLYAKQTVLHQSWGLQAGAKLAEAFAVDPATSRERERF